MRLPSPTARPRCSPPSTAASPSTTATPSRSFGPKRADPILAEVDGLNALCAWPRPKYQARRMARVRQPRLRVPQPSYLPASRSGPGTTVTPSRRTTAVQLARHEQPRSESQTCQRVSFLRGRGTGPSRAADRKQRALLGPTAVPACSGRSASCGCETAENGWAALGTGCADRRSPLRRRRLRVARGLCPGGPARARICPSHPQLTRQGAAACWIFVQRPPMISSSQHDGWLTRPSPLA